LSSRFLGKGVGLGLNKAQVIDRLPRPTDPDQYQYNTPPESEDPTENDHFEAVEEYQDKDRDEDEDEDKEEEEEENGHFNRPAHVDANGDSDDEAEALPVMWVGQEGGDEEYDEDEQLYMARYGNL
jgi:hypothetical protein